MPGHQPSVGAQGLSFNRKGAALGRACSETGQEHFFLQESWLAVAGAPVVQFLHCSLKVLLSKP